MTIADYIAISILFVLTLWVVARVSRRRLWALALETRWSAAHSKAAGHSHGMDQTDGFASVAPNNARRLSETTGIIGAVEPAMKVAGGSPASATQKAYARRTRPQAPILRQWN